MVRVSGSDFDRQLSGHDKETISPVSHARKNYEITSVYKVNDIVLPAVSF